MGYKIKFNAPVVLTMAAICVGIFASDVVAAGTLKNMLALPHTFGLTMIPNMFSYAFVHGSFDHLLGNLCLFLLISPILEERYGSITYISVTLLTIFVTALLNVLFFENGLIGLSGVVFMNIILISFTNVDKDEIPVTFIIILLLFVGREVYNSFKTDNISQFAHIAGGILGSFFGFYLSKRS